MGLDVLVREAEVLAEDFKGRAAFGLAHHGDGQVWPAGISPVGQLAGVDVDNLLLRQGLHRIALVNNHGEPVLRQQNAAEVQFLVGLQFTRHHADLSGSLAYIEHAT